MTIPSPLLTDKGLDLGSSDRNMTYLYGVSDFFSYVFEGTDKTNLILEANAVTASDIYSRFLQLSSAISLQDVQEKIGTTIKLVLLTSEDLIEAPNKFRIPLPFSSASVVSNRPFLPTEALRENIDYRITQLDLTSCMLELARPIDNYKFSRRLLPNGLTQYALWFSEVAVDEQLMFKHFGTLLGIEPEVSTEQFSNFIYGLYYLFLNGPSISLLEQGLNLVLGIPIPREPSEVLDIRLKPETGKYLVITEDKEYLLPIGVLPTVKIGDLISVDNPIAKWIELKDYVANGAWWYNVSIPAHIIRSVPLSQENRFAKRGSRFDELMTEYLYRNTFLIRINVGSFKDNKYFTYLSDILSRAKPAGTQPILVWRVDLSEEDFGFLEELEFTIRQIAANLRTINSFPINDREIN